MWHENKSGQVCARPWCHALRAGASYNYLLVNGERRLTGTQPSGGASDVTAQV